MDNQEKYKEDLLKHYISPGRIEKAPEGFTSKVMSGIQVGVVPVKVAGRLRNRSLVPVISAAVTVIFIMTAFLIPGSKSDSLTFSVMDLLKTIKVSLPELDLNSIFRFNLPSNMLYVFVGILMLSLFDRALYGVFHKEK